MLLCQDVLIDVCKFLSRKQLANTVALLDRRCWLSLFQQDKPFHTYPCHVINKLDIEMNNYLEGNRNKEAFYVTIYSAGDNNGRVSNWTTLLQLDNEDDRPSLAIEFLTIPPSYVRFKMVRVEFNALLDYRGIPTTNPEYQHVENLELEEPLDSPQKFSAGLITYDLESTSSRFRELPLDPRKLELLDLLSANFRGASLSFSYLFAPFKDRPECCAILSKDFFARFFGIFEVIKFSGPSLSLEMGVPTMEQPLLMLPGLIRHKRQLIFDCHDYDFMFDVDETVEWLHFGDTNIERILFIDGNGFRTTNLEIPDSGNWKNLTMELKKHLQCASKTQPYTLYLNGPSLNDQTENTPIPPAAVLAKNYDTREQLIYYMYDPRHDQLPMDPKFYRHSPCRSKRFFRVFRRTTMSDDPSK